MSSDNESDLQPVSSDAHSPAASEPGTIEIDAPIADAAFAESAIAPTQAPRAIAPIWHTLLLVIAILGFSYWGADRSSPVSPTPDTPALKSDHAATTGNSKSEPLPPTNRVRIIRYGLSAGVEIVMVLWIAFGLRLRNIPFRSLFGNVPRGLNDITLEFGVAALFWCCSMVILIGFAFTWQAVQSRVYQHQVKSESANQSANHSGTKPDSKPTDLKSPKQQQKETIEKLMELAPANVIETIAWGLLCLLVGFSEELIFRGYLQTQGIRLLRAVPAGVVFSALVFGAAHGYQGLRGICIIGVYGALFSILTLLRRSLVPGMIAHSWHDFFTGMILALFRASHILDHAPFS
jgi:uncharacterized protein